jgi:hypothetical protein
VRGLRFGSAPLRFVNITWDDFKMYRCTYQGTRP